MTLFAFRELKKAGSLFQQAASIPTTRGIRHVRDKNSKLVYSTDKGRIKEPESTNTIRQLDGIVRLSRETKGRKGKGVTIITGLDPDREDIKTLAKKFKQLCGTGGTVKDGLIEIQGDHRDVLAGYLREAGHTVKLAGG